MQYAPRMGVWRYLKALNTPTGNIDWYRKWYMADPLFQVNERYILIPGVLPKLTYPCYEKKKHRPDQQPPH